MSENMLIFGSVTRRRAAAFAALASLVLVTSVGRAVAQKPSSPVTVTNPATSPVPTTVLNPSTNPALTSSVDDPGRVAYQHDQILPDLCSGFASCDIGLNAVPAGHRLVIQHVSGRVVSASGAPSAATITIFAGSLSAGVLRLSNLFSPVSNNTSLFDQPILGYIDAGLTPSIGFTFIGGTISGGEIILTGYMLDCTNIPCAAIAQ
jgi:hypothetical protein